MKKGDPGGPPCLKLDCSAGLPVVRRRLCRDTLGHICRHRLKSLLGFHPPRAAPFADPAPWSGSSKLSSEALLIVSLYVGVGQPEPTVSRLKGEAAANTPRNKAISILESIIANHHARRRVARYDNRPASTIRSEPLGHAGCGARRQLCWVTRSLIYRADNFGQILLLRGDHQRHHHVQHGSLHSRDQR